MLNVFTLANGRLFQEEIDSLEELARFKPIWVDLEDPTPEERRWVKQHFGLSIPEDAMDEDIEESARFFEEDNGELHVRSDFLITGDDTPRSVRVAFILNEHNDALNSHGVLFSIHDEDVPVFRLLRMRARRMPGLIDDAKDVLLMLFDADAEYCADTLEDIYDEIEVVSAKVLNSNATDDLLSEALSAIARHEDMSGRIRRNVMDTRRAVSFMMRSRLLNAEQFEDARQILRDLDSLDSHTAFLFDKINFLMDATVGFININQNKIIKIFSVASVSLLPPTLVASSYGMNFQFMPELGWKLGHPLKGAASAARQSRFLDAPGWNHPSGATFVDRKYRGISFTRRQVSPAGGGDAAGGAGVDELSDHQGLNDRTAVSAGHFAQEAREVHVGSVVGAVGDGAHDRQRNAEVVAHLREGCAFHFHCKRIRQLALQGLALGRGGHKTVATDEQALVQARCLQTKGLHRCRIHLCRQGRLSASKRLQE